MNAAGRAFFTLVEPDAPATTADPVAEMRAMIAGAAGAQLDTFEDALILAAQSAQKVGDADILHDARTRQLAHQAAAANRRLALELQAIRTPEGRR